MPSTTNKQLREAIAALIATALAGEDVRIYSEMAQDYEEDRWAEMLRPASDPDKTKPIRAVSVTTKSRSVRPVTVGGTRYDRVTVFRIVVFGEKDRVSEELFDEWVGKVEDAILAARQLGLSVNDLQSHNGIEFDLKVLVINNQLVRVADGALTVRLYKQ
jgi:hypothetical protein